jgi:hypothetical protein
LVGITLVRITLVRITLERPERIGPLRQHHLLMTGAF